MKRKWFRMDDSLDATPGRWYLDCPLDSQGTIIDTRIFMRGRRIDVVEQSQSGERDIEYRAAFASMPLAWTGELRIPIQYGGAPLDFTFGPFGMLVMRSEVADMLERVAPGNIQRLPARVEGQDGYYEIINVLHVVDCIDHERTKAYETWAYEDPITDLPGKYAHIGKLGYFVLTQKLAEIGELVNLWRVFGHGSWLVCSDAVKHALDGKGITGVRFQEII